MLWKRLRSAGANVCRMAGASETIHHLRGVNAVRSWCQRAGSEQCSCYPGSLGHFHRDVSGGAMETQLLLFSTNARSRVGWLEVGARLQSLKLFLQ